VNAYRVGLHKTLVADDMGWAWGIYEATCIDTSLSVMCGHANYTFMEVVTVVRCDLNRCLLKTSL
jgi:hypothetical protein